MTFLCCLLDVWQCRSEFIRLPQLWSSSSKRATRRSGISLISSNNGLLVQSWFSYDFNGTAFSVIFFCMEKAWSQRTFVANKIWRVADTHFLFSRCSSLCSEEQTIVNKKVFDGRFSLGNPELEIFRSGRAHCDSQHLVWTSERWKGFWRYCLRESKSLILDGLSIY